MRRFVLFALIAIMALGLSVFFTACGGGGGSSSSSNSSGITSINTNTQGVQAASAGVNVAQSMSTAGTGLSDLVGMAAPKLRIPFASSAVKQNAISKFSSRIKPLVAKARTLRSSAIMTAATSTTMSCATAGTETLSIDLTSINISTTFNNCQKGNELLNGTISLAGNDTGGTVTIGTASSPFTLSTCTNLACTSFSDVITSVATIFTETTNGTTGAVTDNMTANGYVQFTDNTVSPSATDRQEMSNFSITTAISSSSLTTVAGQSATFDVYGLTLNGSVSTTHTETGNNFGEADTFANFVVTFSTDNATTEYYSINGTFAMATNPADQCIEGTFNFVTLTPITVDIHPAPVTVAGRITVNTNVDAVFNSNGVVVTVGSGTPKTYTEADLNTLCDL